MSIFFRRLPLRLRVTLAFALFGAVLSLLLASGLKLAVHDLEAQLIDDALTAELEDYLARRLRNPDSPPPNTATVRGFVEGAGETRHPPPEEIRTLPPGRHRLTLAERPLWIAVAERQGQRFYLLYDVSATLLRERRFETILTAALAVMTLLAAAGGLWLAGRVIAPVTDLARQVCRLRPEDHPPPPELEYTPDEVGDLARAVDRYRGRLAAFLERERFFTGDVSHELRTPLAVIQGAVEVMLTADELPAAARRRVERIARAAREMGELSAALLALAREDRGGVPADAPPCAVHELVAELVEEHRYLAEGKGMAVTVALGPLEPLVVKAERPLVRVAAGNLIANAFNYGGSPITITLRQGLLTVADCGPGIEPEARARLFDRLGRGSASSGSGIGLSLVKRVCDRHQWRVEVESEPGKGATARIDFTPAGAP